MKKPKPKIQKPEVIASDATYAERSGAMRSESAKAEFDTIRTAYENFTTAAQGIEKNSIAAANVAREIGIHLQTLCGHELIDGEFFRNKCQAELPFDFDTAKMFVSVARKMPKPAKTIAEAVQFVQLALVGADLLQLPERTESQQRSTVSVLEKFFNEMTLMQSPWKRILRSRPMEQWEPSAIEKFLTETEWLATERERAAKLKKEKA